MALTHMCRVIQPRWLALVPSHRRTCAHASSHARTNTQALSLSRECTGGVGPPMPTASQYTAAFFRLFSPMAHGPRNAHGQAEFPDVLPKVRTREQGTGVGAPPDARTHHLRSRFPHVSARATGLRKVLGRKRRLAS